MSSTKGEHQQRQVPRSRTPQHLSGVARLCTPPLWRRWSRHHRRALPAPRQAAGPPGQPGSAPPGWLAAAPAPGPPSHALPSPSAMPGRPPLASRRRPAPRPPDPPAASYAARRGVRRRGFVKAPELSRCRIRRPGRAAPAAAAARAPARHPAGWLAPGARAPYTPAVRCAAGRSRRPGRRPGGRPGSRAGEPAPARPAAPGTGRTGAGSGRRTPRMPRAAASPARGPTPQQHPAQAR